VNLLQKLGFSIGKVAVPKMELGEKEQAIIEGRKRLYAKDAKETAELYHSWIPDDVFAQLCEWHDYTSVYWGSRKVARLLNNCRNILDIEILKEDAVIYRKDEPAMLRTLMWMCFLAPIPLQHYHKMKDAEGHWRAKFSTFLVDEKQTLGSDEMGLINQAVFHVLEHAQGDNLLIDIFHDAMRMEEAQFHTPVPEEFMRTTLGKNAVFLVSAHNRSRKNLAPTWALMLQELKGRTDFMDVVTAEENARHDAVDGIG
jgi:hypothetical protein